MDINRSKSPNIASQHKVLPVFKIFVIAAEMVMTSSFSIIIMATSVFGAIVTKISTHQRGIHAPAPPLRGRRDRMRVP